MNPNEFEKKMRKGEIYHDLRMPPGVWAIVRVDGRGFSKFTETRFEKPFDVKFNGHMVAAARALMEEFGGAYAYTESDEISVLLPRNWDMFDREIEKTVSLMASTASAVFTLGCGNAAAFDGRVWIGADAASVANYFRWRQSDASRCCLNGWCYWTLRKNGHSAAEATEALDRQTLSGKNELLYQHGINFNDLPAWQRRGVGLIHSTEDRQGVDPRDGQAVVVTRRILRVDRQLPLGDEYDDYLQGILRNA